MSPQRRETEQATEYLNRLLHQAVEAGAGTVELERVPEGLEICLLTAGSGAGTVIEDRSLEQALVDLIVQRAGMKSRATGKLDWIVQGENRRLTVEEYDSFGECCFRLKFGKRLGQAGGRS